MAADEGVALRADLERPITHDVADLGASAREPATQQLLLALDEHGRWDEIVAAAATHDLQTVAVTASDRTPETLWNYIAIPAML